VRVRLIPRLSSKQKMWPGGPELGQVVQAQLSPPAAAVTGPPVAPVGPAPLTEEAAAPEQPSSAVELLMVLR
jgi:hypothetical protein